MNRLLSILMSIVVALTLLTGAVALPILVRPFYYAQIGPLDIEQKSGMSRSEIIEAYDDVLDYCIGVRDDFAAGILPFSQSGAEHFAECRPLFELDLVLFAAGIAAVVLLKIIDRRTPLYRFRGHGASFWGSAGLCGLFAAAAVYAALDFDRAFTVFHKIFFPGKDNWLFDPATEPVIKMLPEEFFRNCAILIFAAIVLASAVVILLDQKKA